MKVFRFLILGCLMLLMVGCAGVSKKVAEDGTITVESKMEHHWGDMFDKDGNKNQKMASANAIGYTWNSSNKDIVNVHVGVFLGLSIEEVYVLKDGIKNNLKLVSNKAELIVVRDFYMSGAYFSILLSDLKKLVSGEDKGKVVVLMKPFKKGEENKFPKSTFRFPIKQTVSFLKAIDGDK